MDVIKNDDYCSGCGVCASVCPQNAINLVYDKKGFIVPEVDSLKCINCGLCNKKCTKNFNKLNKVKAVYASVTNNTDLLKKCTSGGMFSQLANSVLENGGVVFGAAYTKDLKVKHIAVEDISELSLLQGSKYVQSDVTACYNSVKEYLESGREVLFSGTGCQIAGVISYLGREYSNLFTFEVVCHGVSSPGLFSKYLGWLGENHNSDVESYKFRSKEKRPTGEHSQFYYAVNGRTYKGQAYEDPYYGNFLMGKTLRKSCYNCKFKGESRVSDITAGDFWGIEKQIKGFPVKNGTSMLMINSTNGEKLFDRIKSEIYYKETDYQVASRHNSSLDKPTEDRSVDYNLSDKNLFEGSLRPHTSMKNIIKNRLPWQLKSFLKKL